MTPQPRVLVLAQDSTPLMPCKPRTARLLLAAKTARIVRHIPFTIQMQIENAGYVHPTSLKIDPGAMHTGLALVAHYPKLGNTVVYAAELIHRGRAVKMHMKARKSHRCLRRYRLRHRPARFLFRTKPHGWLAPSLQTRVDNVRSWINKLVRFAPITSIAYERNRFDTQLLQDPNIQGVAYQHGTLFGYEVKEYLLDRWNRTCAYCSAKQIPLEIDHVVPRARNGSNRISNLVVACVDCNRKKSSQSIETFLAGDPKRLNRIKTQLKRPLRDAAMMNATRYAIGRMLETFGLPITHSTGGATKFNREQQHYPKKHWIDAACVGEAGLTVRLFPEMRCLAIKAIGRSSRKLQRLISKPGQPWSSIKINCVHGFRFGDFVRLDQPNGKYAGIHYGTVAIRERGDFDITSPKSPTGKITAPVERFTLLQRSIGYDVA